VSLGYIFVADSIWVYIFIRISRCCLSKMRTRAKFRENLHL